MRDVRADSVYMCSAGQMVFVDLPVTDSHTHSLTDKSKISIMKIIRAGESLNIRACYNIKYVILLL